MPNEHRKNKLPFVKVTKKGLTWLKHHDLVNDDLTTKRFFALRVFIRNLFGYAPPPYKSKIH